MAAGYDPDKPADHSLINASELREQFSSIWAGSAQSVPQIDEVSVTFSDPPTTDELNQLRDKLNDLIAALKR